VKRNRDRFPPDFIFQLSKWELENLRSQFGTSSVWGDCRFPPYVFTEQGDEGRQIDFRLALEEGGQHS